MFFRLLVVVFALFCTWPALAKKRVALLIGNAGYKAEVGPLRNPHNDIELVGDALQRVGFDVMQPIKDATRTDILVAVHAFAEKLKSAGSDAVGFFYYSGHGVASSGENFIVPVEVGQVSRLRMSLGGVRQSELIKILREIAPQAAHYLVFDACRNNLGGSRGGKGFVPIKQESGLLIAFATAPGQLASDLGERGGPYAKALAAEIVRPGIPDLLMFHRVRVAVSKATAGGQIPWTMDGIQRPQRLMLGGAKPPPSVLTKPKPPTIDAAKAWDVIQDTQSSAVLQRFAELYKGTVFAELAKARLSELNAISGPTANKPVGSPSKPGLISGATSPVPTTKQDTPGGTLGRPSNEDDVQPKISKKDPTVDGPGPLSKEPEKQKPSPAVAEREQNVASLVQNPAVADLSDPKKESKPVSRVDLAKTLQAELKRVGCFDGKLDGKWGARSKAALKAFEAQADAKSGGDTATEQAIALVQSKSGIVCKVPEPDSERARLLGKWKCNGSSKAYATASGQGFAKGAFLVRNDCSTVRNFRSFDGKHFHWSVNSRCRQRSVHSALKFKPTSKRSSGKGIAWMANGKIHSRSTWVSTKFTGWKNVRVYSWSGNSYGKWSGSWVHYVKWGAQRLRVRSYVSCVR